MRKILKAFVSCLFLWISFSAHAGQGMYLRLESHLQSAELHLNQSKCVYYTESLLYPNQTIYIEAQNSGNCLFEKSEISYNLYVNGTFVQKYDIHVSSKGSYLSPNTIIQPNGLQISSEYYPSFGLGSQDRILFHVQKREDNWQGDSEKEIADLPLNYVIMPGSHDSGTYAINEHSVLTSDASSDLISLVQSIGLGSYIVGWSKTQQLSIFEQLNLGVRYLDLRLCGKQLNGKSIDAKNNVYICHTLSSLSFKNVIDEVSDFLNTKGHEKEIILLDINHLYDVSREQIDDITSYISQKLGHKIASPQNFSPLSTYRDLWSENKQVILFIDDNDAVEKFKTIYWSQKHISSPWPNEQEISPLLLKMETNLNSRKSNQFFVLQSQMTPSISTYMSGLNPFVTQPRNLLEMTGNYKLKTSQWIFQNQIALWKNGNIIIEDFVSGVL